VRPLAHPVTLAAIKADPKLADMDLIRLSRLSVGRVTPDEWKHILEKSEKPEA
jgi:predicted RNA-binding protein with PUA-like domain